MTILLTGGAGFIGSHMAAHLLSGQVKFVVVDNLSNTDKTNLEILSKHFNRDIPFYKCDLRDKDRLRRVFSEHGITSIIHFAGLKSVADSVINPGLYHDNNVTGSEVLMDVAEEFEVDNFIFSSSATVYGEPQYLPFDEEHPLSAANPYAQTKIDIENLLIQRDYFSQHCGTKILRYFNPVGAYPNGLIGEQPNGTPNNLMPYMVGVANQTYPYLRVFGIDYPTPDGSAIRDYIHIMDLVEAHHLAMTHKSYGVHIWNVGTGKGSSVMEILHVFNEVNGLAIPFKNHPRRPGDVSSMFADTAKIKQELGWLAKRDLVDMCRDAWLFKQRDA